MSPNQDVTFHGKSFAWGAAAALAIAVIGGNFWPGYQLDSTAERAAITAANAAVRERTVALLAPACVAKAQADPKVETVAAVKAANSYSRTGLVTDAGWVDAPEGVELDPQTIRAVADECGRRLAEEKPA